MIFKKFLKPVLLGLITVSAAMPMIATEPIQPGYIDSIKAIPSAIINFPGQCVDKLYQETLGKHPGKCVLILAGFIAANTLHNRYKDYHNNRARIRSQLWKKIQAECYTFSSKGLSAAAKVRDFSDQHIVSALLKKKTDWLNDAHGISRWAVLQDNRLVNLIEEFFVALKDYAANEQAPVAPAPQKAWYDFWSASHGKRLIPTILQDIEECLMGSCG
ncbi:MAG: hypothetical protein AB7F19_04580 [Candidatus Babeliales bacterium]